MQTSPEFKVTAFRRSRAASESEANPPAAPRCCEDTESDPFRPQRVCCQRTTLLGPWWAWGSGASLEGAFLEAPREEGMWQKALLSGRCIPGVRSPAPLGPVPSRRRCSWGSAEPEAEPAPELLLPGQLVPEHQAGLSPSVPCVGRTGGVPAPGEPGARE